MTLENEMPVEARPASGLVSDTGQPATSRPMLLQLTAVPTLLAFSFLVAGFPLLMLGWFRPLPVFSLWAVATVAVVFIWWRFGGTREQRPEPGSPAGKRTGWWTTAALAVIAVAFGVFQALYHGQMLIVTRDPASYMQFAIWIQQHGSLPITPDWSAFGGQGTGPADLTVDSSAFYQVGNVVWPQFMAGMPMAMSAGYWIAGGINGASLVAPLLGALAVFTFGGLVARLVGPRWAPLGALLVALSLPMMYTSRDTFSEPLSEILFLGGLCLLIDALRARERSAQRVLAALAGLCLGLVFLVRLDGPSDILLLIPYCGFLWLLRRPQAVPLAIGTVAGLVPGVVDSLVLTHPYVFVTNISATKPLAEVVAGLTVLTLLAVGAGAVLRRRRGWPRMPGWLPNAAAPLPLVVIALFAVRPYVQTDESALSDAPLSLHWIYWYAGGPVIVMAAIGAGLLLRRLLRGQDQDWLAPFLVLAWSMTEFLYRPSISFDQPFGSRRIVPAVLPGFFLFATWLLAWAVRRARERAWSLWAKRLALGGLAVAGALAMAVPVALTTFDSDGWATTKLYQGNAAAIYGVCARLPRDPAVLIVEKKQIRYLDETLRGMCNVPVAGVIHGTSLKDVDSIMNRVRQTGRQPVLIASNKNLLTSYRNGTLTEVMALSARGDAWAYDRPPTGSDSMGWFLWMWESK